MQDRVIVGTASIIHRISKVAFVLMSTAHMFVKFETRYTRECENDFDPKLETITNKVKDGYFFFQEGGEIDYGTRMRIRKFVVPDKYLEDKRNQNFYHGADVSLVVVSFDDPRLE